MAACTGWRGGGGRKAKVHIRQPESAETGRKSAGRGFAEWAVCATHGVCAAVGPERFADSVGVVERELSGGGPFVPVSLPHESGCTGSPRPLTDLLLDRRGDRLTRQPCEQLVVIDPRGDRRFALEIYRGGASLDCQPVLTPSQRDA